MRCKVNFGQYESRDVDWWAGVSTFPKLLRLGVTKYEFSMYDTDKTGKYDYIFHFSEVPYYDPSFYLDCESFDEVFRQNVKKCECGAAWTSFPGIHMFYCQLWTPIK